MPIIKYSQATKDLIFWNRDLTDNGCYILKDSGNQLSNFPAGNSIYVLPKIDY